MADFRKKDVFFPIGLLGVFFPFFGAAAASLSSMRKGGVALFCLAYLSASFAFLLIQRDPHAGRSAGYGSDAQYYMDAFQALERLDGFSFEEVIEVGLAFTGSAEVFFWTTAFVLSKVFVDPKVVWWVYAFVSVWSIGYSAYRVSPRLGFLAISLFVSTITFYVFPGSGIRQSLAFSLIFCALIALHKNERLACIVLSVLSALSHSSAAPVSAILISALWSGASLKSKFLKVALGGAAFSIFYFVQASHIDSKFASYADVDSQQLAFVQAMVETAFLIAVVLRFKPCFEVRVRSAFFLFVLSLMLVAIVFQGGGLSAIIAICMFLHFF